MLNLFAYGTYKEYMANKANLLDLTPAQKKKLQHLTIVTLATRSKVSIKQFFLICNKLDHFSVFHMQHCFKS